MLLGHRTQNRRRNPTKEVNDMGFWEALGVALGSLICAVKGCERDACCSNCGCCGRHCSCS